MPSTSALWLPDTNWDIPGNHTGVIVLATKSTPLNSSHVPDVDTEGGLYRAVSDTTSTRSGLTSIWTPVIPLISDLKLETLGSSTNESDKTCNKTEFKSYFAETRPTSLALLGVFVGFGGLTLIVNIALFITVKKVDFLKTVTKLLLRGCCVTDAVLGLFGIAKPVHVFFGKGLVKCFLADSLMFSGTLAACLTQLCLLIECFTNLTRETGVQRRFDTKMALVLLTGLWNISIIFGFMPLMGLNNDDCSCDFFQYFSGSYLIVFSSMVLLCLMLNCIIYLIVSCQKPPSPDSSNDYQNLEYKRNIYIIKTLRITWLLQIFCLLPVIIYILLFCNVCYLHKYRPEGLYLYIITPCLLLKAFLSPLVHGVRTTRILQCDRCSDNKRIRTVSVRSTFGREGDFRGLNVTKQLSHANSISAAIGGWDISEGVDNPSFTCNSGESKSANQRQNYTFPRTKLKQRPYVIPTPGSFTNEGFVNESISHL